MKINLLSILFSVISSPIIIDEPPVDEFDTEPMPALPEPEPAVLHTHPITIAALLTNDQLIGCEVGYRLDKSSPWQIGNIRAVQETRFGIKALFTPKDENQCEKWRFLNEFVYVWWE